MKVKTILLGLAGMTALAAGPAFADRGHGHGQPRFKHHHARPHVSYYRPVVVVPPRVVYAPRPVYYHPAPVYHQPAPSYGSGTVSIRLNLPF